MNLGKVWSGRQQWHGRRFWASAWSACSGTPQQTSAAVPLDQYALCCRLEGAASSHQSGGPRPPAVAWTVLWGKHMECLLWCALADVCSCPSRSVSSACSSKSKFLGSLTRHCNIGRLCAVVYKGLHHRVRAAARGRPRWCGQPGRRRARDRRPPRGWPPPHTRAPRPPSRSAAQTHALRMHHRRLSLAEE